MSLIVTSRFHDRVLWRDTMALAAAFVPKPMTAGELLAALYRTAPREATPDGTLEPAWSRFEYPRNESRQAVDPSPKEPHRRSRERHRDIATFLFLQAFRR
jgi:hypothetical protein